MTQKIVKPTTSASLLADIVSLICHPNVSDEGKAQAVQIAYEIGKSEGRVAGAESMGNTLLATLQKSTMQVPA